MNVAVYARRNTELTTTAGTTAATVASATGLAAGDAIKSENVPLGTTIGALAGTDVTLAFPPQYFSGSLTKGVAEIQMGDWPLDLSTLDGAEIVSPYFPAGTTVDSVNAATRVLTTSAAPTSLPPLKQAALFEFQPTGNAITETGADADALFTGAAVAFTGTVQIERSFDGGETWFPCNIGGSGALAQFTAGTPVSVAFGGTEDCVLYRINCLAFTPVANVDVVYRMSATGPGSNSINVQAI